MGPPAVTRHFEFPSEADARLFVGKVTHTHRVPCYRDGRRVSLPIIADQRWAILNLVQTLGGREV
jgi:hypothetical protein